jgi:hypothetical protein
MNISGVTNQEHATDKIAVGQPRIHLVGRRPMHRLDGNVVAAGALGDHPRETFGGKINVTLKRNRGLQLKQFGSGKQA